MEVNSVKLFLVLFFDYSLQFIKNILDVVFRDNLVLAKQLHQHFLVICNTGQFCQAFVVLIEKQNSQKLKISKFRD